MLILQAAHFTTTGLLVMVVVLSCMDQLLMLISHTAHFRTTGLMVMVMVVVLLRVWINRQCSYQKLQISEQ